MNTKAKNLPHRGRIQVQGDDMKEELSAAWAQNVPRTAVAAWKDVDDLEAKCSPPVVKLRDQGFAKARRYIDEAKTAGGCGPVRVSFQNRNLPPCHQDARVDIEVLAGVAFQ
jgi:hypothetical protein